MSLHVCKQDSSAGTYQGNDGYSEAVHYFKDQNQRHTNLVQARLKERMTSQENELLTYTLHILLTHGWARDDAAAFGYCNSVVLVMSPQF